MDKGRDACKDMMAFYSICASPFHPPCLSSDVSLKFAASTVFLFPLSSSGILLLGSRHASSEAAAGDCVRALAEAEGMRLTVLPLTRTSSSLSPPRLPRLSLPRSLKVLSKAAPGSKAHGENRGSLGGKSSAVGGVYAGGRLGKREAS